MKAKSILPLSFVLLAATVAQASTWFGEPDPALRLAQASAEERRALQQRWQRLSPEEQALLRQELRQLQELPPEQRELRRREILENWREHPARERWERTDEGWARHGWQRDERDWRGEDEVHGFGRGYERRQEPRERPGRR